MPSMGDWWLERNGVRQYTKKPRVFRKERRFYWAYPWLGFNGLYTVEFETWAEAMRFALGGGYPTDAV